MGEKLPGFYLPTNLLSHNCYKGTKEQELHQGKNNQDSTNISENKKSTNNRPIP